MTEIWYKDLTSFFYVNNLLIIFPTGSMTQTEKLNSLFRLSIYISTILYLLNNNHKSLYIFIVAGCITYIFSLYDDTEEEYVDTMFDETDEFEDKLKKELHKKNYTLPTKDNPFMNVLMHEYTENPKRKKAISHSRVNDEIEAYFNKNLYRSVDDLYNKNASDRQYITMPNTEIPNDQDSFARALYFNPNKTCKEGNGLVC
jgi:hypothetical protein